MAVMRPAAALFFMLLAAPAGHASRVEIAEGMLDVESSTDIPELIRTAESSQYASERKRAMKALVDLGTLAGSTAFGDVFTKGLVDDDKTVRGYAYEGLQGIGKDKATSSGIHYIARLASTSQYDSIRKKAMYALYQIGGNTVQVADIVIKGLVDDVDQVRSYAQTIYKEILNGAPESAVRYIADLYRTTNYDSTRRTCFNALVILDQDARPAASEVTMALADDQSRIRDQAKSLLGVIRATTSSAISHLAGLLDSQYESTRKRGIWALQALGRDAEPALAKITWALQDDVEYVRRVALQIVQHLGKVDSRKVAEIGRLMASTQYDSTKIKCVTVLVSLGGSAKPAQNELIGEMTSSIKTVASNARTALKNIQDAERAPQISQPKEPVRDPSRAEDAECFCFNKMDYDEEAEYQKVGFAQCAGMAGTDYRCDKHCNRKSKYHVTLSSESSRGTQTVSYCQDDGDCQCLDAQESSTSWEYKLIHTFSITQDKRLQSMNLGECYSKCNNMCKDAGWTKGGCVWPKDD